MKDHFFCVLERIIDRREKEEEDQETQKGIIIFALKKLINLTVLVFQCRNDVSCLRKKDRVITFPGQCSCALYEMDCDDARLYTLQMVSTSNIIDDNIIKS
uniref:AlNc14C6G860 protein n=1 Tax=Albugo laibachii Nc14 TaxID=890382 RepID=F0W191_9STRA|nr:AlNc14C6G860 [Albugo laibachii Nc14]|eukprot:CCA14818.1 AlNc14C6G860 [Albugo laibachii Nc14]